MKSLPLLLSVVPAMRLQNLITLSLGWLTVCVALAQIPSRGADRVVVVRNENSPVSRAVADDYAQRRSIQHVVGVRCQDSAANPERETIACAAFQESLEKPLREFLSNHPSIDFIVLTKGIPQGVTGAKGYTNEPLLQAVASPSILWDRYTHGKTLAESFHAASRFVGWEDTPLALRQPRFPGRDVSASGRPSRGSHLGRCTQSAAPGLAGGVAVAARPLPRLAGTVPANAF